MKVGVEHALEMTDVFKVSADLRRAVLENDGPDYLRVFECEDGRIVWAIDQSSKSIMASGEFTHEQMFENIHRTMLPLEEY